jgi:hypothetical protein
MPLQDDLTIPNAALLYRILHETWTTNKGGRHRPSSIAFFEAHGEVSYFADAPGVLGELRRIFQGKEIASVPASVIRDKGLAIERRPNECPPNFQSDKACHVVVGPAAQMQRNEYEKRARSIAKHDDVKIVASEPPLPAA